MAKPIVILSCDVDEEDRIRLRPEYFEAISDAGAIPIVMPPFIERSRIDEWVERVGADALLLTGGADIDPQFYGETPLPQIGRVSLRRDAYEAELLDCALKRGMPVLGICRGMQVINVALGGSLYQDMKLQMGDEFAMHDQTAPTEQATHEVAFIADSDAARLFGTQFLPTNSHHHQCIRTVGAGLIVSGTTVDGVAEAIEMPEHNVLAVQFHPERMTESSPEMASFFKNWVDKISTI